MGNYLAEAHYVVEAYFLYAAFTDRGYIKVGISRIPFERIATIHQCSPHPVMAAMWTWIGSKYMAGRIELLLGRLWADRNTRGEWYKFDYADEGDKRAFFTGINATVEAVTGNPPEWQKKGAQDVRDMLKESVQRAIAKQGKKRHPWRLTR